MIVGEQLDLGHRHEHRISPSNSCQSCDNFEIATHDEDHRQAVEDQLNLVNDLNEFDREAAYLVKD